MFTVVLVLSNECFGCFKIAALCRPFTLEGFVSAGFFMLSDKCLTVPLEIAAFELAILFF